MKNIPKLLDVLKLQWTWLAKLQLNIKYPVFLVRNETACISFTHPFQGEVIAEIPLPLKRFVKINGIGFELKLRGSEEIDNISCYDNGAIFDPIDGYVPGDHYATSHFALLCAILYKLTKNREYIPPLENALHFLTRTGGHYAFQSWPSHWEFDNFALTEIYFLIKDAGLGEIQAAVEGLLLCASQHRLPYATNWKLLALNYLVGFKNRSMLVSVSNWVRRYALIFFVARACLPDGCIEDVPGKSSPIQYHAFSGALLARLHDRSPSVKWKHVVYWAAKYLYAFIDLDGNFNYKGRGQNQIFGYAAAIYLLLQGYEFSPSKKEDENLLLGAKCIYNFLIQHQNPEGSFPLTLNGIEDLQRAGWHDYHHITVYNAMVAAWLGLALCRFSEAEQLHHDAPKYKYVKESIKFYSHSRVVVGNVGSVFLCVSGGEDHYDTDCGLALHHLFFYGWGAVISCPGGPDLDKFGKQYRSDFLDYNYYSPLIKYDNNIYGPQRHTGSIIYEENVIKIVLLYDKHVVVQRSIQVQPGGIAIEDTISIGKVATPMEVIGVNIPLIWKKDMKIIQDHSNNYLYLSNQFGGNIRIEFKSDNPTLIHFTENIENLSAAGNIILVQSSSQSVLENQKLIYKHLWTYIS